MKIIISALAAVALSACATSGTQVKFNNVPIERDGPGAWPLIAIGVGVALAVAASQGDSGTGRTSEPFDRACLDEDPVTCLQGG